MKKCGLPMAALAGKGTAMRHPVDDAANVPCRSSGAGSAARHASKRASAVPEPTVTVPFSRACSGTQIDSSTGQPLGFRGYRQRGAGLGVFRHGKGHEHGIVMLVDMVHQALHQQRLRHGECDPAGAHALREGPFERDRQARVAGVSTSSRASLCPAASAPRW